jgi:beta-lactamase class A
MADLLTRIFNGKALSPESTRVIIGIMERCRTSPGRLKGILPRGTLVAHKTGTIGGTANDVGVMTLPGKAGQIVIAVYVKKSMAPTTDRDRTIAEIARAAYDYFLVTSPAR